jgi:hypothetical protein
MEGLLRQRCRTIRLTSSVAVGGRRSVALAGKRHTGGGFSHEAEGRLSGRPSPAGAMLASWASMPIPVIAKIGPTDWVV